MSNGLNYEHNAADHTRLLKLVPGTPTAEVCKMPMCTVNKEMSPDVSSASSGEHEVTILTESMSSVQGYATDVASDYIACSKTVGHIPPRVN